jgi:serine/threonine protein kinase/TolB-like protein
MDQMRWDRVQALFHRAAELAEPERPAFLAEACGADESLAADVRRMLEEDARASLLDRDVTEIAGEMLGESAALPLKEFGPYRILKLLGEGGMGVVYLAERSDLGNQVAIKILRDAWLSPARLERFAQEQRTLAQLNHPSIARLYDANTLADGTPWFVMEYVDGVPATEYCSRKNCSIEERLKLIRAVAAAVEYLHEHGVIHRDLKPSNILVREDGSARLVDFGIAKQLDATGRPMHHTLTAIRAMTLAYASPEQIRGEEVGKASDVYSLGVVLYELLAGRLPFDLSGKTTAEAERIVTGEEPAKPSETGRRTGDPASWADLDALCLAAMEKDPRRRYASAGATIRDIDHYLNGEPLEARHDTWRSGMARFARRNFRALSGAAAMLAMVGAAVGLTLAISRKPPAPVRPRTVAVLPLVNATAERSFDFLSLALADEISRTLGYARSLTLRPPELARKFGSGDIDVQKAGHELHAATTVSGRFLKAGDNLQVTLSLADVESNRVIWTDVFDVPAANMIAMQAQIAFKTRHSMAPLLGVSEFVTANPPKPKNESAYQLYLRAAAMNDEISTESKDRQQQIALLNQSVAIDPSYAPAWELLASCHTAEGWFGNGGQAALARSRELADRAVALDPDNIDFRAATLYYWGTVGKPEGEAGGMSRGGAFRQVEDLLRRRPDNARLHFLASWILRDAGMLDEAARECDASVLIDAQDAGARSCGVTFMLRGEYRRALDYLDLDATSEVSRAVSTDVLVREGKVQEAIQRMEGKIPTWGAYNVLMAGLEHRSPVKIAALAREVRPAIDPEINFFSSAHLSYAGQTVPGLAMLKAAIEAGYCSVPAIDSDPFFANLRTTPGFQAVRAEGQKCHDEFLRQREGTR